MITKIDIDYFLRFFETAQKQTSVALVRIVDTLGLAKVDIALPGDRVLSLRKEDVLTMDMKIANILLKKGIAEIIGVEVNTHDMGISGAENMANVES